jgi:glycosyltransferase involved in cell wall biosynthesis
MSTTLSVIIPVYNVERTLRHCVDSVLAQDVDDMEVILVDDGSTDNSPAICDDYGRQGKARVTHQRNGGLSAARNTGMALATGRFITFVDSDDYIQADTYRPLLSIIGDGYDIVEYPVERETPQGLKLLSYGNHTYTSMQSYWVDARGYEHAYAWNKLYRRTLFDNVQYPEGQVFEDVPTLYQLLRHAHTVHTTEAGRYHYTSNPKGITQQADGKDLGLLLKTHVDILTADTLSNDCRGLGEYYRHVLNIQLSVFDLTGDVHDLILPVRPYWGSIKLLALHLLGLRRLCRLHRRYFQLTTKHAK